MIIASGKTDIGRRRKNNEDCFLIDRATGLCLVADGMGGHRGGSVASRMTVEEIFRWQRYFLDLSGALETLRPQRMVRILQKSIEAANTSVFRYAQQHEEFHDMGATVAALQLCGDHAVAANVGDARVYLLRDGELRQLSKDHTWKQNYLDFGCADPGDFNPPAWGNVVTRAIGGSAKVRVQIHALKSSSSDLFLLCSDGLLAMLPDAEIAAILIQESDDLEKCCNCLIDESNRRGGSDNITVLVTRLQTQSQQGFS